MPAPLLQLVRRTLYRPHLENGLSVAVGVAFAGMAVGWLGGLAAGIAAATGALCASVADQPDPLPEKPWHMGGVVVMSVAATVLALFAKDTPGALMAATGATGFAAGIVTAYGRRGLGLGMAAVIAFVLTMSSTITGTRAILLHTAVFAAGAVIYALFALISAWLFDRRVRRLLLAEAMRSFARYLRTKARLLDAAAGESADFAGLLEAHASLVERLQIARDAIYARSAPGWQRQQVRALIALLDAFETILSSDADIEILQASVHRHLLGRLRAFTTALADDVEALLAAYPRHVRIDDHEAAHQTILAEIARIAGTGDDDLMAEAAFRSTADKLALSARRLQGLKAALDGDETGDAGIDLSSFRQSAPGSLAVLAKQFRIGAPAMRFATRLSLAMMAGLAITFLVPDFAHSSWILLTIALIMRANYSVTRQRRADRVIGTLFGCLLAAALLAVVPPGYLLAIVAISVGVSHAFAVVNYRVTAVSASISSLLLLHFIQPAAQHVLLERMVDTLIGAGISYAFAFLLPNWERNALPGALASLLKADAEFAKQALSMTRLELPYRVARKTLFDSVAALSGLVRRMADEPQTGRDLLTRLNNLLSANYLLLSDLSSMQVLFGLRKGQLDEARANAYLAEISDRVNTYLTTRGGDLKSPERLTRVTRDDLLKPNGMSVLKRRLIHIDHAAQRVARLADEIRG
jgi:uncharacterized membrane protein YccC